MKTSVLVTSVAALAFATAAKAQTTVVSWTFETSLPATAGPFLAEGGLQANTAGTAASGFHAGAATYSNPAGNGSSHSFSANTWAIGDYYQFTLGTTGFADLSIGFDQTSSTTGPRDFKLSYSINGTSFTDVGTYTVQVNGAPNAAWNGTTSSSVYHESFDLSSIDAIENISQVTFRLIDNSAIAENGSAVATTGTDRVDNFTVTSVPEPGAFMALAGGIGVLAIRRRRVR
jgi:hypothetical protein